MTRFANLELQNKRRLLLEKKRNEDGRPHEVIYFHSVSDPYSYLVLQKLESLKTTYNINLNFVLVGEPPPLATPEPEFYKIYSLIDAKRIAPFYNTKPPKIEVMPNHKEVKQIEQILTNTPNDMLLPKSMDLAHQLWQGDLKDLEKQVKEFGTSEDIASQVIKEGDIQRQQKKHYLGAVFHYEGENYWGLDRLYHLENRLTKLGLQISNSPFISTRSYVSPKEKVKKEGFVLEFYPSLNSPYTYISFNRVKKLTEKYSIKLKIKPVLPMLMRNMKIPGSKGAYILNDASREGKEVGVKFNKILTPIGKPAERAYSLFMWVNDQDKGFEYLHRLMVASFHDGKNIYKINFLNKLIQELGLNWEEAEIHLDNDRWRHLLEKNRLDMYDSSIWGVPAFKLISQNAEDFSIWGQDRLWLLENEILSRV